MIFRHFSKLTILVLLVSMSNDSVIAMKRSREQAFETNEQPKTKTIELSLNPKLVHNHELREFDSISEACKAYGVKEEYSGGHPVNDEMSMYSLKTEIDETIKDEFVKKEFKRLIEGYTKIATSWSNALCLSYNYKVKENNKGDFSIAEEFIELASNSHFGNDIVHIAILGLETRCILNEQIAPRFFQALNKLLKDSDFKNLNSSIKKYILCLSDKVAYDNEAHAILIGFLLCKHLTNDELMFIIMHELTHADMYHYDTIEFFKFKGIRKKRVAEISRMTEREADSTAMKASVKPHAMLTSLIKMIQVSSTLSDNKKRYFKDKNFEKLVEYVKHNWRFWFSDEIKTFDSCRIMIEMRLSFCLVTANVPIPKRLILNMDSTHPTSFERICYALSQDKLQDKQKTEEQQS